MIEHIQVIPDKCRACRRCEVACIAAHHGMTFKEAMKHRDVLVSRVQVVKAEGFRTTVRCHQCNPAPCCNICPTGALQQEEDGRITCTFSFDNLLATPISIKNVRASCGCTTPNWSREPIAPNAKGEITVTYNTKGRPGMFQKSVTVTFSDGTQDYTQVLFIKGKVTPRVVATPAPEAQPATK